MNGEVKLIEQSLFYCIKHNHLKFKGPILVTKKMGYISQRVSPKECYLDVELTDFSDIIDFFLFYGTD